MEGTMISTPIVMLFVIIIVALIAVTVMVFQQKSHQVKTLLNKVEELNNEIETSKRQATDTPSIQGAYLHFIYNLSHEVSNPLQSVQTNLENMADCSPEEIGRWKQYYVIIRQEMRRLFALTENLRLLSQLESNKHIKREPINMRSIIENVMMAEVERASAKNINLKYQGPNRPAKILGNRDHLYEVILNLVDNSIKYSKDSGGEIVIMLGEDKDVMRVTVTDNGIGISEEDLPFIFDTAYRSSSDLTIHRTGSGLGLAIVKRIVNQHEGEIRAKSVLGEGTTITVDLPFYTPEVAGSESTRI
jgi:signal transduction histidine kinase